MATTQLVNAAHKGQPWALQMLFDRVDGKVKEHVTIDNNGVLDLPAIISALERIQALKAQMQQPQQIGASVEPDLADVPEPDGDV